MRYLERMLRRMLPLCVVIGFAATACGPKAPTHNGYKSSRTKPWKKAKKLAWSDDFEAEVEDTVSYPKRKRAAWYEISAPRFGEFEFKLEATQLGEPRPEFDLAFEIVDASGRVLVRADLEEEDAGEETKTRTITEVPAGLYWVHIYTQARTDEVEFQLRVKFTTLEKDPESTFPTQVAYLPPLAAVPPVDDAPPPTVVKKPRCRKPPCRRRPRPDPPPDTGPKPAAVKVRIVGISSREGRTAIRIAAGANRGIEKGWRGSVVSASGKGITGGGFVVTRVTGSEAYASVKATADAVNAAKYVVLRPPN